MYSHNEDPQEETFITRVMNAAVDGEKGKFDAINAIKSEKDSKEIIKQFINDFNEEHDVSYGDHTYDDLFEKVREFVNDPTRSTATDLSQKWDALGLEDEEEEVEEGYSLTSEPNSKDSLKEQKEKEEKRMQSASEKSLQRKNKALREVSDNLQSENFELKDEIRKMAERLRELEKAVSSREEEKEKFDQAQKDNIKLKNQIKSLETTTAELSAKLAAAEHQDEVEEEIEEDKLEVIYLNSQLHEIRNELSAEKIKNEGLTSAQLALQSQLDTQKRENEKLTQSLAEIQQKAAPVTSQSIAVSHPSAVDLVKEKQEELYALVNKLLTEEKNIKFWSEQRRFGGEVVKATIGNTERHVKVPTGVGLMIKSFNKYNGQDIDKAAALTEIAGRAHERSRITGLFGGNRAGRTEATSKLYHALKGIDAVTLKSVGEMEKIIDKLNEINTNPAQKVDATVKAGM